MKEIQLEYKANKLPLTEIICYLPIDYEISSDTLEKKHKEFKEEINRGSLLITAYHVKDFLLFNQKEKQKPLLKAYLTQDL